MEGSAFAGGMGRCVSPYHTRAALLWRSRHMRIIKAVPAWKHNVELCRKSMGGVRAIPLGATNKRIPGATSPASGAAFSRYLHAVIQKDYAVGYLCLAMLSKGTTALWAMLEVLAHQQSNAAHPYHVSRDASSSGPVLAKALQQLAVPQSFVDQLGSSVVLPSMEELAQILDLSQVLSDAHGTPQALDGAQSRESQDGRLDCLSVPATRTPGSLKVGHDDGHSGAGGDSHELSSTPTAPRSAPVSSEKCNPESEGGSGDSSGGRGDWNSGGGAGGGGGGGGGRGISDGSGGGEGGNGGEGEGQQDGPQPTGPSFQSQLWMAVAISLALIIPPSALVALLLQLSRPLVQLPVERQTRPRLARRVSPRKQRFVLLQHASTQALDGEGVLLLSPRSIAATLLFPTADARKGSTVGFVACEDPVAREIAHSALHIASTTVSGQSDLPNLPLSAQLAGLADALTAAYERETRLAARLITRRAVSFALSNEKLSELATALDMSGRALVASKRRMEALSCSMEELHQEMERDVSLLCDQLESMAEQRDALMGGRGTRDAEIAEAVAAREGLAVLLREAEASRQHVQAQLADLAGRLEQSDACARLALHERDQERRRASDLTAQLKHAARFATALEGMMSALPDLPGLVDDTAVLSDVGDGHAVARSLPQSISPPALQLPDDVADDSTAVTVLSTPLRTVLSSAQHRASELLHLQRESAALQLQVRAQAAAHAADAAALARAQQEAGGLRGDVARLEEALESAIEARRGLEADLVFAQAALADLQDQLQTSAEELAAARRAQHYAEVELSASQAERISLDEQLQQSHQDLAAARAHLAHAQHHVAEALAEKGTLRQQLAVARQHLAEAEAEAARNAETCREAQDASSGLALQLGEVKVELDALAAKLKRAQSDAGSALAAKAGLELELARVHQQAAACASAASERLHAEMAELQAHLDEAQAGRRLAELEARELRDRVAALELQLAAAEAEAVSAADAEAQRVAELRGELGTVTAALHNARAAAAAARDAEASQAAAVQAAAVTVSGLQATIMQLRQSLAAAQEELQQQRAEAAAAAATNAARAAKLLHDLHLRDAAATALNAHLAEVRVQLGAARADADNRAQLQVQLAARLQVLQSTLGAVETADVQAARQRDVHASDLAQRCEAACRAVADMHFRLETSEAARRELLAQAAEAEAEQRRLLAELAGAEAERGRLQEALRAAGEMRAALEVQVAAGEASLSELQARLHRAEEVLSEALSQLSNANSAVRLLHQRAAGLETPRGESIMDAASISSGAEPTLCRQQDGVRDIDEEAQRSREDALRSNLTSQIQLLLSSMEATEAASAGQRSLQMTQVFELQRVCEESSRSIAALRGELTDGEADRQQLLVRLAASEASRQELLIQAETAAAERKQLLARVAESELEREALSGALVNAASERARLEAELADADLSRADFVEQLHGAEAARADLQAQLSFSNSALQLLQQHLQSADAERLDLQAQLTEVLDERRELRSQLAVRLQVLESSMDVVEAAAMASSHMLTERASVLQEQCEASGLSVRQLLAQLAASEAERQELLERATEAEAARQALAQQIVTVEAEQQVLALQAAETAEAAQQALHAALGCADAERRALQAKVRDSESAREGLLQRLGDSEAARAEALQKLAMSGAELAALQLRLEDADRERLALQAAIAESASERRDLQAQLARVLQEVEGRMGELKASAVQVDALRAAEAAELQRRCDDESARVRQLQEQLAEGEAARRDLQRRLEEACDERQRQLEQLVAAASERQELLQRASSAEAKELELSARLEAADAGQRELKSRLEANEAAFRDLQARVQSSEAAQVEAQAELADVNLALRFVQQNLDAADAERQDLQGQLAASMVEAEEARDARSKLAARITDLTGAVALVQATAGRVDELQEAQCAVLHRHCEASCAAECELRAGLAASNEAQLHLLERLAVAKTRQQALQSTVDAAGTARLALEAGAAEADAARGVLLTRLEGVQAAREEALARLTDANASLSELQRRVEHSDLEREELKTRWEASRVVCEALQAELEAAGTTHDRDERRLAESESAREDLAARVAAADAALMDLRSWLSSAEASHASEVQALRASAAAAADTAAAQLAEASAAQQLLQGQLSEAEVARGELAARLEAAEALRGELRTQLAASSSALRGLQEQLEGWETACTTTEQQLARTDALARDLMAQLEESEARRLELQARLASTEAAFEGLHAQLADSQRERDNLAARLAEAEAASSGLQMQVYRFRTQLAAATDSAVIRRMTNATAIQEQYERLTVEVVREREEAAARQEQLMVEIASLQAAADESAVRATVRVALARACLRAVEDERQRLQEELEPLLLRMHELGPETGTAAGETHAAGSSLNCSAGSPKRSSASFRTGISALVTNRTNVATSVASTVHASAGHHRRRSSRVVSLGGFLEAAADCTPVQSTAAPTALAGTTLTASTTTAGRPSATDYQQQLEDVRQRLIELRPQTASRLAAVDAALEVPSSFADMVQSAVASASPLAACRRADRDQRPREPLRDSFCMVPDLGSLGSMLDANSGSAGPSAGGAPPAARQENVQVRCPPAVPFSTPVTEYRQSNVLRAARFTTPPSTTTPFSPPSPLLPAAVPIEAQLAVLQDELNKVEETGRLLGARLEAASQSPAASILETVTAQLQQAHSHPRNTRQDVIVGRSTERSPLRHCSATDPDITAHEDAVFPEPFLQLDLDVAPTPPEANVVASSLAALRNGIQSVIAQHQLQLQQPCSPHGHQHPAPQQQSPAPSPSGAHRNLHSAAAVAASLGVLLAHVQVLEDHLLGASLTTAMPTPTGMLLPLPRSAGPVQAPRYPVPGNKSAGGAVAGGAGVNGGGGGVHTDGGSTPHEEPSPKTEISSEPVTTPSDSPLLMATDSPAPPVPLAQHSLHSHIHHHQLRHHHLHMQQQPSSHPDQDQHQLNHILQQQLQPTRQPRQDLIAADGILMRALDGPGAPVYARTAAAATCAAAGPKANGPALPLSSGGGGAAGRRVAAIHALAYEESSMLVYSPSLTSLTQAQTLPPAWERNGSQTTAGLTSAAAGFALASASTGAGSVPGVVNGQVLARHRMLAGASAGGARPYGPRSPGSSRGAKDSDEQYNGPPQHEEWRSESHSPQSLDEEATVLTATPLACSPAQPGAAEATRLPPVPDPPLQPPPPYCSVSLSCAAALASTLAAEPIITPVSYSRRGVAPAAAAPAGDVSRGYTDGMPYQTSSPSTPVSDDDDVRVATPLAFTVAAAAATGTPCLTPQPLDAYAAEQLLRYTNPCFARTPSASELGAGEQAMAVGDTGGGRLHGRRGYERPFDGVGPPVPPMPSLGDGLPALEMSESVDITVLRAARRRAAAGAGLSAVSIEQAPVASMVQVTRGAGQSMPFLAPMATASTSSAGHSSVPNAATASAATVSSASAGGAPPVPPPPPQFVASNAESISLYGSGAGNGADGSYRADPHASGLLCLPTRSRRFSFRLSSRQGSRSSMVHPNESNASGAADDTASISGSLYQYPSSYTHLQQPMPRQDALEPSAGDMPPLPPLVGGKRKKGGLLGKIKRAMGISSATAAPAASASAGSAHPGRGPVAAATRMLTPRPSFS